MTKLYYLKATYLKNVWFVCSQARTEENAYNRVWNCLTDERSPKYLKNFKLELSNKEDYEAGHNYDYDFPKRKKRR